MSHSRGRSNQQGYSGRREAPTSSSYSAGQDSRYYGEEYPQYRSDYASYENRAPQRSQGYGHDASWGYDQAYDGRWGTGHDRGYDEYYREHRSIQHASQDYDAQWRDYHAGYARPDARYAEYPSYGEYASGSREYPASSYSGYADYRQETYHQDHRDARGYSDYREYDTRGYSDYRRPPADGEYAGHTAPQRSRSPAHYTQTREFSSQAREPYIHHDDLPLLPSRRPTPPRRTEPREEYLAVSLKPSPPVSDPTTARKLIVLDLNGSLLLRSAHQRRVPQPQTPQRWQGRGGGSPRAPGDPYGDPTQLRPLRTVHRRPYLTSFAAYILHEETKKWLDTMVWSSAQPHSVADMVEQCFGMRKAELKGIWARDTLGLTADDYNKKSTTLKDLEKPWAELFSLKKANPSSSPRRSPPPTTTPTEHSALTTILIDDSSAKAALQPWNHLCIKEYLQATRNLDLIVADWEATLPKGGSTHAPSSDAEAGEVDEHAEAAPGMRRIIREVVMINGAMVEPGESIIEDTLVPDIENTEPGAFVPNQRRKLKRLAKKDAARQVREEKEREAFEALRAQQAQKRGEPPATLVEAAPPMTESTSAPPPLRYDETLLAVVGVLDRIKYEGNVAGWMRSGGLLTSALATDTPAATETIPATTETASTTTEAATNTEATNEATPTIGEAMPVLTPTTPSQSDTTSDINKGTKHSAPSRDGSPTESANPTKRRKLSIASSSGDPEPENDDACASALPTPPPSSQLTAFTAADEAEQVATGVPLSSPIPEPVSLPTSQLPSAEPQNAKAGLWYENPAVLLYWAERGRAALKELGIPVESGMIAVPGASQNGKMKGKLIA